MSETWTSLLSGVVGAIVGGAASLAGTMLVNRQQMATNARMRLYEELLPRLEKAVGILLFDRYADSGDEHMAEQQMPEVMDSVRRTSAIAGRQERSSVHKLVLLWSNYMDVSDIADFVARYQQSGEEPAREYAAVKAKRREALDQMRREIKRFSDNLAAKLG